ncbi:phospholipase [Arthrobacter sp. ERGS1:01]|uniref:phosphocholine-specific phospholipase C n=1 Tax=Arthrobacter sp. ERGS1:01 TaxID=1704044 RepID=UPI0006B4377C|nr:phospholipase C, phosphocholine-specific [Arthrobacter sp. ERGS1:01]ALE06300.1 phospholipase [Arthrobacter sp. ERGS1:01]
MTSINRRTLLGGVAAAAASMALPASITRALAAEPNVRTGTINDVEHVVILMQENRSFDHYFGTMRGVRGFGDPRPWLLPNGQDVWHQPPAEVQTARYNARGLPAGSSFVLPFPLNSERTSENIAGTDHGWSSGHLAWNNGRWDQWVNQKQDVLTMAYLTEKENSFHRSLANNFTICDAYFASVHADTAPNRIALWTGTLDPQNRMGTKPNGPGLGERNGTNGYTWTTYAERLQDAGISWRVYQGGTGVAGQPTDNYTDNSLEFFANFQRAQGASGPLVDNGASTHTLAEMKQSVLDGTLPAVSWVVSPYKYSEHPSASPTDGAYYIDTVLDALTADPAVWAKTALILNYDENDGFFDHVVPPMPPVTNRPGTDGLVSTSLAASLADEILDLDLHPGEASPLVPGADPHGRQPIGLGPRVPLVVVSPWSKGGWVCSEVFDHTSVIRFLEKRFRVAEPNISDWRRSVVGDLTSAFDFSRKQADFQAMTPPAPIHGQGRPFSVQTPQAMPVQDPGVRPARPLPYRFGVELARVSGTELRLEFANRGKSGAYFQVRNGLSPADAPRRYQVAAADTVRDSWANSPAYALSVWGANGYLAEFKGSLADADEVAAGIDDGGGTLVLVNSGNRPRKVRVANSYSRDKVRKVTVPPRKTVSVEIDLADSYGWFDVTVTDDEAAAYFRRFAGHRENGKPSFSDPAAGLRRS